MSETKDKTEYFDLDEVLEEEVKFGKYQVIQFFLIGFPIFLNSIFCTSYIFTAGTLNYRCKVPECEDSNNGLFITDWLNSSTPFDESLPEKCERFAPLTDTNLENSCSVESFDRSINVKCDDYVYEDDEITILNKFNLNCDKEFFLSLIGTLNNIGQLFSYLLTGILSDRYGRKIVLIVGCVGSGVFGILRIFATNYVQFAIFEFFDALFGAATFSSSFVIGLELVVPKLRTIFGTLLNCFYAIGMTFLALIAMWLRNYKYTLLITYAPAFLVLFYIFILPQSIRWLIMKGRNEEAKKILLVASKFNKTSLSKNSLERLNEKVVLRDSEESISKPVDDKQKTSRRAILQIANISYLWFATIFVYYGLNINAVYLEYWDKYISFIVVSLVELPGYFLTNIMMEKLGRKKTLFIGMVGSGIFCIISEFIQGDIQKTVAFVIGKLLITISLSCLYIFTIEVFPTNLRHRFFSICSMVGRLGSILTPLTPFLAQNVWSRLPLVLFSSLAFTSSIFLFTLPETLNRKLPETMEEAFN